MCCYFVYSFLTRAHDTVGAVAVDSSGNVACATSTGGIRNKMVGRVGDSPVIGMTTYTHIFYPNYFCSLKKKKSAHQFVTFKTQFPQVHN